MSATPRALSQEAVSSSRLFEAFFDVQKREMSLRYYNADVIYQNDLDKQTLWGNDWVDVRDKGALSEAPSIRVS